MNEPSYDLIIIGGGIAGMCAALRAVQYNRRTLIITGDKQTAKASRSKYVLSVDNMMGIHDSLGRDKILKQLADWPDAQNQLKELHFHLGTQDLIDNTRQRIEQGYGDYITFIDERADDLQQQDEIFIATTAAGQHQAPYVIVATGVMDRQPVIHKQASSGKDLSNINWIYPYANNEAVLYCIRCEGHLTRKHPTAVIGASESAAQIAMMLHERYHNDVSILTNGEELAATADTQRLLKHYGITIKNSPIIDILGKKGKVLNGFTLEDGSQVEVKYAFVAMGIYKVYNELAKKLGMQLEDDQAEDQAHVVINAKGESSIANAFAIGDMTRRPDEPVMKQIYTAQEYAVRAVDTIDSRIRRAQRKAILNSN